MRYRWRGRCCSCCRICGRWRGTANSSSRPFTPSSAAFSDNTLNVALRRLGFESDEMTSHGFRAMASMLPNESGLWHPDGGTDAALTASGAGSTAAMRRGSHQAAAACDGGTPQPLPLRPRTGSLNEEPSARSSDLPPSPACATSPPSSGWSPAHGSAPRAKLAIAVLLLGRRAWSSRTRDEPVPYGFLPFQRKDRTIKPWHQTPRALETPLSPM